MQKLVFRSPPGYPLLLCSSASPSTINSLFFSSNFKNPNLISCSFSSCNSGLSTKPEFMAFSSPPTYSNVVPTPSPRPLSPRSFSGNCRICKCSLLDNIGGNPQKPWVVLKETRSGPRLAWLHTIAGRGNGDGKILMGNEDDDENEDAEVTENNGVENENEDTPTKLQRRSRSSGNSGVSLLAENPDLLTIPGVGPRNLRKLVEKGIGVVDDLKQIYRDKVITTVHLEFLVYFFFLVCSMNNLMISLWLAIDSMLVLSVS